MLSIDRLHTLLNGFLRPRIGLPLLFFGYYYGIKLDNEVLSSLSHAVKHFIFSYVRLPISLHAYIVPALFRVNIVTQCTSIDTIHKNRTDVWVDKEMSNT
jgi:hypothetical protein